MSETILLTKLHIPPVCSNIVRRPRLIKILDQGAQKKLTLISAPAGFGKTTVISEWINSCKRPAAWLSLDEGDNDPARFLAYFVAALQSIEINLRKDLLDALKAFQPQTQSSELLLTELLNEISKLQNNFVLVLDDYHVIESKPVDQIIAFLVENHPLKMQLVIATREDPPFSLPRLRMRGQLTEIRASDLRFTPAEASDFLNQMMGLNLRDSDISALEARTEGWIAGLQLAALSMQGRSDSGRFIQSFTGSNRFVVDYLVGEVLEHQSEKVRTFLLETAILSRLCGSLCDEVTGQVGGREMLETLERGNLFVIPLDDERKWYRYHHLFSDVLKTHLIEEHPEKSVVLHKRASEWYENHGFTPDAIHHALTAEDYEHAAKMIELAWSKMDINYQSSTWLGWVKKLPVELIRTRPVLSVGYAWALLDWGELESSEIYLLDAEKCLNGSVDGMIIADEEQFHSLPASIASARAYRSLALGDVTGTIKFAQQALELTPENDQARYSQAIALLGLAQYTNGDLKAAEQSFTDFYLHLRKAGELQTLIGITFLLGDIKVALGHLHDAEAWYQKSLRLFSFQEDKLPLGSSDLYRGLSELHLEWNDLEKASEYFNKGLKLGEQAELPDWKYRSCITHASIREAQGDLEGALDLINEAERVHIRGPLPDVHPVVALRVRVWLKQGKLSDARGWADEQKLSVDDDLSFMHEFEYMMLARFLYEVNKEDPQNRSLEKASHLLDRLLQSAEMGHRQGSVIHILLLQALVYQAQNNESDAMNRLELALSLAEPEGYIRIFVDEGNVMQLLIEKLSKKRDHPLHNYILKLHDAFSLSATVQKTGIFKQKTDMIDPLSERELEVLKLLRGELTGPEMAQQLTVSLNTLRTHTKNIFNKLGVNTRRAAVRRAEELNLF